jgi:hypothetical protein
LSPQLVSAQIRIRIKIKAANRNQPSDITITRVGSADASMTKFHNPRRIVAIMELRVTVVLETFKVGPTCN